MKPRIDGTEFGAITIDGSRLEHDVLIRLSGKVAKRKKNLSKAVYGASHTVSLAEAEYLYEKGAERLIVGAFHASVELLRYPELRGLPYGGRSRASGSNAACRLE